ncbi:MAG: fibronectin type III domain-containing protein [Anaerolineae bacterium]|jgi:hypothetical protein
MPISGIAWGEGTDPPYITDDLFLSVERTTERAYLLTWSPLASASFYLIEEATNPQFSDAEAIFFGEDTQYPHTQPSDGTFYYRVKADAAGVETSRWSNVVSVTVPWTGVATSALSPGIAANGPVTVQVRMGEPEDIEITTWHAATTTETTWGGWEWSYEWELPERQDTQYLIQTRASGEGDNFGSVDTITVTVDNQIYFAYFPILLMRWPPVPYAPSLSPVDNADKDDTYVVSWTYGHAYPPVSSYILQEAKDANFTVDKQEYEISGTTSKTFTGKTDGTYYYRVQGKNEYGLGPWSNPSGPVTVESFSYFDDFSDHKSGWPREWSSTRGALYRVHPNEHPKCPGSGCKYDEGHGYLIARRSGGKPSARFGPGVKVPGADYEITLKARWFETTYYSTYQIFFGSDKSFDDFYAVQVRYNHGKCDFSVVEDSTDNYLAAWSYSSAIRCEEGDGEHWDRWKIRRKDNEITVWVNDTRLGKWTDSSYGANRYFGVGATTYEGFTPSKPEFDNWSVELID